MQHTDNPTETFHIEFNRCLDLVREDTDVARRFALLFTLGKIATAHYDSLVEEHRHYEDIIKTYTRLCIFQSIVIVLLMIVSIIT